MLAIRKKEERLGEAAGGRRVWAPRKTLERTFEEEEETRSVVVPQCNANSRRLSWVTITRLSRKLAAREAGEEASAA